MTISDFRCPLDGLSVDVGDIPLSQKGGVVPVGKHVHMDVNQTFSCENGHTFTLEGSLLLSRSA